MQTITGIPAVFISLLLYFYNIVFWNTSSGLLFILLWLLLLSFSITICRYSMVCSLDFFFFKWFQRQIKSKQIISSLLMIRAFPKIIIDTLIFFTIGSFVFCSKKISCFVSSSIENVTTLWKYEHNSFIKKC